MAAIRCSTVGGINVQELAQNWAKVLLKLMENNLTLSPDETYIYPARIRLAGWIWNSFIHLFKVGRNTIKLK